MLVYGIHISRHRVATRFGCREIFNNSYIAHYPQSLAIKKIKIRLEQTKLSIELGVLRFGTQCIFRSCDGYE